MKLKSLFPFGTLVGGLLTLVFESNAQEKEKLEEIVVTATRIEEPKKEVSSFVQIHTQEEIRLYPGRDVGDLLSTSGIGHIHKYPGVLTTVRIRGMSADVHGDLYKSRVLYLIDGNRAGTANLAKIPLDDIERIEILKGPASVLYGTQAMGGVVNIITKKAKKEGVQFEAGAEGGSWDHYKGKLELMGKKGELNFYLLGTRSAQKDYTSKRWGKIKNSGYDDESFSAKLGYKFLGIHELLFSFQHQKGWKIGSPGARYEPDINDYSDKGRKSYTLSYSSPFFKGSLYFIKDEDEWYGLNEQSYVKEWTYYKKTESYGVNLQKDFKLKNLRVLAGGEIHGVKLKTDYLNLPWSYFSISSSEYNSWGIFSEAKIPLLEERLLLFVGARYDYFKNSFNYQKVPGGSFRPKERNFDHTTLRSGLVYKLSKNLSLKTNLGTGFRAPTPEELARDFLDSLGRRWVGNPSLKAEKSLTWDGGVDYSTSQINFTLSYFITNFKDKIISGVPHPNLAKTFTYKNTKGAKIQGLELNLSSELASYFKLPFSVKPFINLTYHTQYRDEEAKASLTYTPKWTGSFGIRARGNLWDLDVYGIYVGDEKVIDWRWDSPTYGQTIPKKDFTVFNTGLSVRPYQRVEVMLKVENLFNRFYEYIRGYPMPERTFKLGLSYKF